MAFDLHRDRRALRDGGVGGAANMGGFRWVICGLLFAATVCNYMDRQMIGLLKPTLQHDLGWTEISYASMIFWFQAAYAVSYVGFGWFIDKVGVKLGYAIAFAIWTIGHTGHALASTAGQFIVARITLGVGEAGSFPASLKAVAEWFPKRERAFAIGVLNAGSNVGAIATPLIVPAITLALGWRWAFVLTGLGSSVWLIAWWLLYANPSRHIWVNAAELAYINSDAVERGAAIPWRALLGRRQTWAYALAKFLTDPIWWMFLFWLPDFLAKRHQLDLQTLGPPLIVIYIFSDLGSIGGGWFSTWLMRRGWSLNAARKMAMLVAAIAILPVSMAARVDSLWVAVAIVALAAAAHQWFSCNLFALPSDVFPRVDVGSVAGIGGAAGAVGGMVMARYVGEILQHVHHYTPIFAIAACVYLIALLVIQVLVPRYDVAQVA